MNTITRRHAIRASSFALATPLVVSFLPNAAVSQTPSQETLAHHPLNSMLHVGLANHVMGVFAETAAARSKGKAVTQEHLARMANAVRVFGAHLQQSGFDQFSSHIADAIKPSDNDLSSSEGVEAFHAHVLKYDPGADIEDIRKHLRFSTDKIALAKQSLSANSVSWHFNLAADLLYYKSLTLPPGASTDSLQASHNFQSRMVPAVYQPGLHLNLYHQIGFPNWVLQCTTWVKNQFCNLMQDTKVQAAVAGAIGYAITKFGFTEACAALIAGSVALTIGTDGGAGASTIGAAGACQIIQTIPSPLLATMGVGAAVQQAMEDYLDNTCG